MRKWPQNAAMTLEEAEELFNTLDDNKNELVEYSEFCQASWSKDILKDKETLRIAFDVLDHNGDGFISFEEAEVAFGGNSASDSQGGKIWANFIKRFKKVSLDREEGVNFAEFE